jgi:hypothetical protein
MYPPGVPNLQAEEARMSMEEWNQWVADSRSIETMRNIALDALEFEEDDGAFYVTVH